MTLPWSRRHILLRRLHPRHGELAGVGVGWREKPGGLLTGPFHEPWGMLIQSLGGLIERIIAIIGSIYYVTG